MPSAPKDDDNMPLGEGWFRSQLGVHQTRLTVPPCHRAPEDELVDAKYLRFTISYTSEPTIEATMGRGTPHYTLPIMASPVEGRFTPPANDEEDLAFLAEMHMMNSALNRCYDSWDTHRSARPPRTSDTDEDARHGPNGYATEAIQRKHVLGPLGRGVTTTWSSGAYGPH
jgi:hypothetical protein